VRALLDTHTFLWAVQGNPRLSDVARELVADAANEMLFSSASAYEIAVEAGRGRLELPDPVEDYLRVRLHTFALRPLPITVAHAIRAAGLPAHHGDPWDRILIAQAQTEGVHLITADPAMSRYDVEIIW